MYKRLILIGLVLIHSTFGLAAEKIVGISTLNGYPPFCFEEDGVESIVTNIVPPEKDAVSFKGYSWDIVRESFSAVGYTIKLEVVPWARAMNYVKISKVDLIFPATRTEERIKDFNEGN